MEMRSPACDRHHTRLTRSAEGAFKVSDYEYRRAESDVTTEQRPEVASEAPLAGTVLLDEELDGAAGGLAHIGEEIPQ
jgi:hypothetical protein